MKQWTHYTIPTSGVCSLEYITWSRELNNDIIPRRVDD